MIPNRVLAREIRLPIFWTNKYYPSMHCYSAILFSHKDPDVIAQKLGSV